MFIPTVFSPFISSFIRTPRGTRGAVPVGLLAVAALGLAACEVDSSDANNNNTANNNGGGNNNSNNNNTSDTCPQDLPVAATRCDVPDCSNTSGSRTVALADLEPTVADRWLVISHAASPLFDNENLSFTYTREISGGLSFQAGIGLSPSARRARRHVQIREAWGERTYASIFGPERRARIAAERRLREASPPAPLSLQGATGTAIRGRGTEGLPPDVLPQLQLCSAGSAPSCGNDALCVVPEGSTDGRCESSLTLKFRPNPSVPSDFENVTATVRAVGNFGAIVVDDADNAAFSNEDVTELLDRFERRIAPVDHAFFGLPRTTQGEDRDGNGVVILFFTSRVAQIDENLAGFFQALDLQPSADAPGSNAADMLYMQPPGANVSLDQLSGTIGHEYQHLINYYSKVINQSSSQEEVWLDEGLSTFAEDMLGYGADSFRNVAAYLVSVGDTSLTGFGLINVNPTEADSLERRGMAHLLVRYVFEQAGGAVFDAADPGAVTDRGGIAAVRRLVTTADTGIDAFSGSDRSFTDWVRDLLTLVAIDGADIPDVSCNPEFTFADPEVDDFTGFQRGLDLRTSIGVPGGTTIPLNGPMMLGFEAETVPVPLNGGEIRTLDTPSMTTIGLAGPANEDFVLGLRVLPVAD